MAMVANLYIVDGNIFELLLHGILGVFHGGYDCDCVLQGLGHHVGLFHIEGLAHQLITLLLVPTPTTNSNKSVFLSILVQVDVCNSRGMRVHLLLLEEIEGTLLDSILGRARACPLHLLPASNEICIELLYLFI